jgi:hypothetical protein
MLFISRNLSESSSTSETLEILKAMKSRSACANKQFALARVSSPKANSVAIRHSRIACRVAFFVALLFVGSICAQPLNIAVSSAQYATYVEAQGYDTNTHSLLPPISRMTILSSPVSDKIDVPFEQSFPNFTNHAIASAGLFEVLDHTGWGVANAGATNQLWFSPLVDQTQEIGIQITNSTVGPNTAGSISLLDLTSNSELWNYSWTLGPTTNNIPWAGGAKPYGVGANFNVDTVFLASHQYELTMSTFSNAGDDSEDVDIQLTGLQVVPEPSSACFLLFALLGFRACLVRRYSPPTR